MKKTRSGGFFSILSDRQAAIETAAVNTTATSPIKEQDMLWTICVILIVLWLLGMATAYTMGGLIHILLVIAIIVVLVRVIQGRRVL
jgi:hypothetical protein